MADNNPLTELGTTGLKRWGGYIGEEWLTDLRGTKGIKVYQQMADDDPVVGAMIFAIKMLCRQVIWRVDTAGKEKPDREAADFLTSCMDDMSAGWHDTISEILSFLIFGWSYHEVVYKRRQGDNRDPSKRSKYEDGKYGWRKMPIRAQSTLLEWDFDVEGGVQGMRQLPPPDYQTRYIPIDRALLFRTEATKGSPEGRSILRNAYRPWKYKKNIEIIEGIGVERDLAGLPVAWVPPNIITGSTTEEKATLSAFKSLVTNIRRDEQEGIVMPLAYDEQGNKSYDLSLLSTGGRRQFETGEIIQRYNTQIAQSVLADFIMLGTQKVGSFALSTSKTHIFSLAITAFLDEVEEVFNTHAVPRLFKLNGMNLKNLPQLKHGGIEDIDLVELGDFIGKLAGAGAALFPNENLEKYLLALANLPVEGGAG